MDRILRIDSHQHFWLYSDDPSTWIDHAMPELRRDFLPKELEPILREHKMDGSVLVQAFHDEGDNEFLMALAARHPFVKGVVGWLDLNAKNVEERLTQYAQQEVFKGVRHTEYDAHGEFLLRESFLNGIRSLADFGLTYDILLFEYQLVSAVKLVQKFPDQVFVLNHMGKPQIGNGLTDDWKASIQELGKNPNVFCKLSGMTTDTRNFEWETSDFYPFLDVVVGAFGVDRLMFGSDWPVHICSATYPELLNILDIYFSGYSQEDKEKIYGLNAMRAYSIKDERHGK